MRLGGTAARPPAALAPLLLLALLATLARPVAAAYAVASMACPSGVDDIVTVTTGSNLSAIVAANGNGPGKTYILEAGHYILSSPIQVTSGSGRAGDVPPSLPPPPALDASLAKAHSDLLAANASWAKARSDLLALNTSWANGHSDLLAANASWANGLSDLLALRAFNATQAWPSLVNHLADEGQGHRIIATEDSTTCFIGGGSRREDVVITAAFSDSFALRWFSDNGAQINLGLQGLTLDGNGAASGVVVYGSQAGWAMEDVTIQETAGNALVSYNTLSGELVDVAFERCTGDTAVSLYATESNQAYHWSNLTITDCNSDQGLFVLSANVTLSGRIFLARQRGGPALYVLTAEVTFTGDVVMEGNSERAAEILVSTIRLEASSTLQVKDNVSPDDGGGFYIVVATVSILGDAWFTNNAARGDGGAMWAAVSSLNFGSAHFTSNAARGDGGAMWAAVSSLNFGSAQFTSNTARGDGGAVWAVVSPLNFADSTQFTSNTAGTDGGAVRAVVSPLNFGSTQFTSNTAGTDGGAVWAVQCPVNFADSTRFTSNTAGTEGGAVWALSSPLNFEGSAEFTSNAAGTRGGAVWAVGSPLNCGSADFTSNTASTDGGAVWAVVSPLNFADSTHFTSNTAGTDGGAVWAVATHTDFGSVCIKQNAAGGLGSGIFLIAGSSVNFTSPGDARMGANSPLGTTIVVEPGSSWTCAESDARRGPGNYSIEGPPCACQDAAGGVSTCACPANTPTFEPATCACKACLNRPCTLAFVPDRIASPLCEDLELLVVVRDAAPAGSSSLGLHAERAPAAYVPVVFGVSGDCEPNVQPRTVRTDAQGRARVRVTAQGPGVAAVVAAVTSGGGSLPRQVALATSRVKFLPCGHEREYAYDDDVHDGYGRRPSYDHTRTARPYAADENDAVAEAFEAAATQTALQALKESEQASS